MTLQIINTMKCWKNLFKCKNSDWIYIYICTRPRGREGAVVVKGRINCENKHQTRCIQHLVISFYICVSTVLKAS